MAIVSKSLAKKLTGVAQKQIEAGVKAKEKMLEKTREAEKLYFNIQGKMLKGQYNVPLPVMGGFVDALTAKIDDPPNLKFKHTKDADLKKAQRIQASYELDSSATNPKGMWDIKDILTKKIAIFCGRGINKYFAESLPRYASHFEITDYIDFYGEAEGGWHLENHQCLGQLNIIKEDWELKGGARGKNPIYDKEQVKLLLAKTTSEESAQILEDRETNKKRLEALGLADITKLREYRTDNITNLTEHYMTHHGKRYYLLLDPVKGIWVRVVKLGEVFKSELWPYTSWATHPDAWNFWSKAPVLDVIPIAETMKIVLNETLLNLQRRNRPKRIYDSKMFPNPERLMAGRPDAWVPAKVQDLQKALSSGVYEFKTQDTTVITINLMNYLNDFLGEKTGVTPAAQGRGTEELATVFVGNLQQVADRVGLTNKFYKQAQAETGLRYKHGMEEHMPRKRMVEVMGAKGIEWEELVKGDADPDFGIEVTGGNAEIAANEQKKLQRTTAVTAVLRSPIINQLAAVEEILRAGGIEEDVIKRLTDPTLLGDQEILSEAAQAIDTIVESDGKEIPKLNRGATTGFIRKIIDYAYDTDLEDNLFAILVKYGMQHMEIAMENMVRKARMFSAFQIMNRGGQGAPSPLVNKEVPEAPPEAPPEEISESPTT
ncbi:MAG TPA: hypothetical protein ENI13_02095 [candidate division CPR3 bacterium]|uniref:Uncharacterized protein n=1 Tax=candidate division CPR3 bacterium TaxID=2268181 RepID=A0A7C1SP36_UNCC3|nr:hypothetical protein [candidate division CPR3 bacterium]